MKIISVKQLLILILVGLLATACTATTDPTPTIAPTIDVAATPTLEPTSQPPTEDATAVPTPTTNAAEATAVPDTNTLLTTVQNGLPANAFDGLAVLPLNSPVGGGPLWAVHSAGFRNFDIDPLPNHFVAIYTWQNNSWQELARQELNNLDDNNFGPDYIYEQGVTQVDIDPATTWLAIDGGVGAHGGSFQLLRFDGATLHLEVTATNSSPGLGYLEDLNNDGAPEVILRAHDYYVFCYACGVRLLNFVVYTWDAVNERMLEVTLQPMLMGQQGHPARQPTNRAVELANAGLWQQALPQIEEAERLAAAADEPTDTYTLTWDAALIRLYNQAYQAELDHAPYPLLTNIFSGDYAAALDIMRGYGNEQLFSATPPVIQGTMAEGNEQWLAGYILTQSNAAVAVPDLDPATLAAAHYFRAWATYLNNPADPQIGADLQQAATLNPAEPLYNQVALPTANRIQFGAGETAASVTGNLQPQGTAVYTLAAQAGQMMTVMLTAPDDQTRITVLDGQGGYVEGPMSLTFWQGTLPDTGDYVIRVFAGETAPSAGSGQAVDYTLQVIIPQRISFAPGATSATVQGDVAAHVSDDYILSAQAGQTMTVNIDSPNSNVLLTIVGADGIPLTNGNMSGATSWQGQLPATQDYTLRAIGTLEPASYTLTVTIE
ncbi:MAG: hypothetical protein IT327_05480 [Anaerolineae bacterium]|nr:hypothetical protein [Anaerolineae bacterium]